jgi:hypothetical protein
MDQHDITHRAKAAVKRCQDRYGAAAWEAFGADIRDAMVCREVISEVVAAAQFGGDFAIVEIARVSVEARTIARE